MDAASKRSPILIEHALWIHVKEFNNNLLLKIVMLWLVSLRVYRKLDIFITSALSSLNKLTWKLSSAFHPVCSNIIAAAL